MMTNEVGDRAFPIWLLGDSNPKNWQNILKTPLDPRHPARHSIWTPVLDEIQEKLFRLARIRLDDTSLFIRNSIENPDDRPKGSSVTWSEMVDNEVARFGDLVVQFRPPILISFGAFAFEFARRSLKEEPTQKFVSWGATELGKEFRKRVDSFDPVTINLFPLLHASISRGKFIQSHDYYCGENGQNYFEFVGNRIAEQLIKHQRSLQIWIG